MRVSGNLVRGMYILTIVCCILFSLAGAVAQDKTQGGIKLANIDLGRIQDEDAKLQGVKQTLQTQKQTAETEGQTWSQNPFLSADEQKQLSDFLMKEKSPNGLSPADKKAEQALQAKSKQMYDDYQRLQGLPTGALTDTDKQQLNYYVKLQSDTQTRVNDLQTQYEQNLQNQVQATTAEFQKELHDALGKVAHDKGYTIIYTAEVAPYAENDCTDDVLKLLNKK